MLLVKKKKLKGKIELAAIKAIDILKSDGQEAYTLFIIGKMGSWRWPWMFSNFKGFMLRELKVLRSEQVGNHCPSCFQQEV